MTTLTFPQPQTKPIWPEQGQWTYEDWLQLPNDGFQYEVLDGELYMSPPPGTFHQNTLGYLYSRMRVYADDHDLGIVLSAPTGVRLPNQPVPVQPDILFVSKLRQGIIKRDEVAGAPDLVVEVLSPSNWTYDRGLKQEAYRQAGVREYWIVDYRARKIEVLQLEEGDYVLVGEYKEGDVAKSAVLTDFSTPVAKVFAW